MTVKFNMPPSLMNALIKASEELQAFIYDQRDAVDGMPGDWHDGEQAESVEMWLDDLDRAVGELNDIQFGCME